MNDIPRIRVDELLLEVSLTSKRHIVVEGASDDRFFRAWAMDIAGGERVVVTSVERVDVAPQWLIDIGLNDGNRARLVFIARRAHEKSIDLRCVADRDCGHHVEENTYTTLTWTDFPALESYAVEESVLDRANLLSFAEKLPPASDLLPSLAFALGELFAVRSRNEHLPKPKYQAGFKNRNRSLMSFDVVAAVDMTIRSHVESYTRPSSNDDPRAYAYGHDIAELLLAVYGNTLKNHAGLSSRDAVEGALRSAIQAVGKYKDEPMFRGLADWVAA
ncbi:hypothetical protein [Arthrobacter crystallopoietes]|uniref:DUF4435 domain-containing protein n=1 Tax=Crystallibacter crystallopoietes TaxID=37928 RepID=A0A1H1BJX9_9MICC|nr:hypothetical protein [Arthrobacter crystallopoietes]AUI51118.1 hypothetical protein AC20117_10115 [Arthrobacter crystallopoietes]SDQ52209.1 hypothetical protein SAMN04489742_1449 [Arthrobacter crystallopoietes]